MLVGALAWGETVGWPFLATPLARRLTDTLQRDLRLEQGARLRFLGGLRVDAPRVDLAAPGWSTAPHTLAAEDLHVRARYIDLWRTWRDGQVRLVEVSAHALDLQVERLADGRASWQLGLHDTAEPAAPLRLPLIESVRIDQGTIRIDDAPSVVKGSGTFQWRQHSARGGIGLSVDVTGDYRGLPLRIGAGSTDALPRASESPTPVWLDAHIGRSRFAFRGGLGDGNLGGRFDVSGPSLAAVGDPLGLTLPTTGAFETRGWISKKASLWNVVVSKAEIGGSSLRGAFTYQPVGGRPLLSGRVSGTHLALADLGPAVGVAPRDAAAAPKVAPASGSRRVLPDRQFDLPALRAMDANVLIDLDSLDLGTSKLGALKPLRTHLVLNNGVLRLDDLDARTAEGSLRGSIVLDGRAAVAAWNADLRWRDVRLERWLMLTRGAGQPPWLAGRMDGQAQVHGAGRSTAQILGSLQGKVRLQLRDAAISHLAVEASGLDLAQALGVFVKGDDALPVQCAVADLTADKGVLRPQVMVIDTVDSSMWIDGSIALSSEQMDLRAVVTPKDFSPLTLRTPVLVRGTLADPQVSLEKGRLSRRVGAAAVLAFINPLIAWVPLIDTGDTSEAQRAVNGCKALAARATAQGRAGS